MGAKARIGMMVMAMVGWMVPMGALAAPARSFVFGGYMDWTYTETTGKPGTFDAYHFNPIFMVSVSDNLLAEAEVEFEHGGDEIIVEYMSIAWMVNDYFTLKGGKFLLPFGAFNDRLHPTWISKVPGKPLGNDKVVPVDWSDTGIMATGAFGLGVGRRLNYALYLVNGFTEDATLVGGSTRDLRREKDPRSTKFSDKSFGGRLGFVPMPGTEIGVSGFQGRYAGGYLISLYGMDAEWHLEDYLEIRGEFNTVVQGSTTGDLTKAGWYLQAAYKLGVFDIDELMPFEVALRFGAQDFPGTADDFTQVSPTVSYYIGSQAAIRAAYHVNTEASTQKDNNQFQLLFAMGF